MTDINPQIQGSVEQNSFQKLFIDSQMTEQNYNEYQSSLNFPQKNFQPVNNKVYLPVQIQQIQDEKQYQIQNEVQSCYQSQQNQFYVNYSNEESDPDSCDIFFSSNYQDNFLSSSSSTLTSQPQIGNEHQKHYINSYNTIMDYNLQSPSKKPSENNQNNGFTYIQNQSNQQNVYNQNQQPMFQTKINYEEQQGCDIDNNNCFQQIQQQQNDNNNYINSMQYINIKQEQLSEQESDVIRKKTKIEENQESCSAIQNQKKEIVLKQEEQEDIEEQDDKKYNINFCEKLKKNKRKSNQPKMAEIKCEEASKKKKPSYQFQNMKKLIMNGVLKQFKLNILKSHFSDKYDQETIENISKLAQVVRETGRYQVEIKQGQEESKKNQKAQKKYSKVKIDHFSQAHFNLLYLSLNQDSIKFLQKKSKDVELHEKVFNIDLSSLDQRDIKKASKQINEINNIKKQFYEISKFYFENSTQDDDNSIINQQQQNNNQHYSTYIQIILHSIQKMIQGKVIQQFNQSILDC